MESTNNSTFAISQIVVSDDSTDSETARMVKAEFPDVSFTEGPRRGLGANRNNALRQVRCSHVLFIDDDAVLTPDYFTKIDACLREAGPEANSLIITGAELNNGHVVLPHKPSFLGFQSLDYGPQELLRSIVINSTVFPADLFRKIQFDENLIYGGEELDIAAQAVYRAGYCIRLLPAAANYHFPANTNRDYYLPFIDASRIFVTFKRYKVLQRNKAKAFLFLPLAYANNLMANLRSKKGNGLATFWSTLQTTQRYIRSL